jgi:cytochrome c556
VKASLALFGCLLLAAAVVARVPADTQRNAHATSAFESVATPALPNAHRITDKVIAGAEPEGDQGFEDLRSLGIKTIVSVDGSKPDVELAHKYGYHYVHLPITYSGVTEQEGRRIAKALADLDGPIYIHCHHGKHRAAAAVAVGCVENGTLEPERAESVLKTMGTGENFRGLWQAARDARPLDHATLEATPLKYVEQAQIPALADRMVHVDQQFDNVKLLQKSGWQAPADHPDLDPAEEALLLQEHFREAARTDDVAKRPADFKQKLAGAESHADALRAALASKPVNADAAKLALAQLGASCASCHKAYRD